MLRRRYGGKEGMLFALDVSSDVGGSAYGTYPQSAWVRQGLRRHAEGKGAVGRGERWSALWGYPLHMFSRTLNRIASLSLGGW